jgi:hypothetical protein
MMVRGMGRRQCLAFIPLTIIPLTMPFPLPKIGYGHRRGLVVEVVSRL